MSHFHVKVVQKLVCLLTFSPCVCQLDAEVPAEGFKALGDVKPEYKPERTWVPESPPHGGEPSTKGEHPLGLYMIK